MNEIVFAGSHDAGITRGDDNVQTQNLDIAGQASAAVRFFDLRIAARHDGKAGGQKQVALRAFHADSELMNNATKTRFVPEVGRVEMLKTFMPEHHHDRLADATKCQHIFDLNATAAVELTHAARAADAAVQRAQKQYAQMAATGRV